MKLPDIRITGQLAHRSVTVDGYELPAVTDVKIEESTDALQRVTVTLLTDYARVDPPDA